MWVAKALVATHLQQAPHFGSSLTRLDAEDVTAVSAGTKRGANLKATIVEQCCKCFGSLCCILRVLTVQSVRRFSNPSKAVFPRIYVRKASSQPSLPKSPTRKDILQRSLLEVRMPRIPFLSHPSLKVAEFKTLKVCRKL